MRSEKEIREKLKELDGDERLHYPLALVEVNAPLALIQCDGMAKVDILKWVLDEKKKKEERNEKSKEDKNA